jgi:hypothetical protein
VGLEKCNPNFMIGRKYCEISPNWPSIGLSMGMQEQKEMEATRLPARPIKVWILEDHEPSFLYRIPTK